MGNMMLCWPNRCDEGTLVSASNTAGWTTTLPLSNLKIRQPGIIARSSGLSPGFNLQLPAARTIRGIAVVNHNLTLSATYTLKTSNETSITNKALYTEDYSNAAWVKTTMTVTAGGGDAPGAGVGSNNIAATAANSTIIQDLGTIASAPKTFSIWMKRVTGSGSVQMTLNGGTGWTTKTITTSWARYSITATLADPDIGIRLVTSGDQILVAAAQLEDNASAMTSYYISVGTAGVRPAGYIDHWQTYLSSSGSVSPWPAGYTAANIAGSQQKLIHLLSADTSLTGIRIDFSDATNAAGYLEFGRLFLGGSFQPAKNLAFGLSYNFESRTRVQESISGSEYFWKENPFMNVKFTLPALTETEAMTNILEMQRISGIDGEVLFLYNPDDTTHNLRRSFVGRLRELTPLEYPYTARYSIAMEIRELI